MPTLTVRTSRISDLLAMRRVRQCCVPTAFPLHDTSACTSTLHQLRASLVPGNDPQEAIVALVDDELCAFATFAREDERYRWIVTGLAAGSPRVDATDAVAVELWSAILEYGIKSAGKSGARRLTAAAPPQTAALQAMYEAGFVAYMRYQVLSGRLDTSRISAPIASREFHESDAWSIHQLYNRVTPRPVQFAEARTSDWWVEGMQSGLLRRGRDLRGIVVDASDGLAASCRVRIHRRRPLVTFLVLPELTSQTGELVYAALQATGLVESEVDVVIPDYDLECVAVLERAGLRVTSEHIVLVRHTTVPRVIHPVFEDAEVEAVAKRAGVRGVPNLSSRTPEPVIAGS